MYTSSSEEGSWMAGHQATSDLESTGSHLFSLPSDASDVQTDITPPTSPTPSEGKMCTPRDILDASRRLQRIPMLALQENSDAAPTRLPKQVPHRSVSASIANDEAGYDADGDGDGDEEGAGDGDRDGDEGSHGGAGTTVTTRPIRRPGFVRIDTRQHRRVASMLATRRPTSPEPSFEDADRLCPLPPRRVKLPAFSTASLKKPAAIRPQAARAEVYELRRRPQGEPVGLGIGFPENHPLRGRAFSMPMPRSPSPISDLNEREGKGTEEVQVQDREQGRARRFEWLPSGLQIKSKKKQIHMHMPVPSSVEARAASGLPRGSPPLIE